MTRQSDLDWYLLINGPVKNSHFEVAKDIERVLNDNDLKKPGPTGVFGNMVFSHDLVHNIGGEFDTNQNMTRRILLLLESKEIVVKGDSGIARNGVLSAVWERYLTEDSQFDPAASYRVPRFLLNDVVRLWRTMGVDYAAKYRVRRGDGWAIRNLKLRFSRKLIFTAGLAMCFDCHLSDVESGEPGSVSGRSPALPFVRHLRNLVDRNPIDLVSDIVLRYGDDAVASGIFENYDRFLEVVGEEQCRNSLDSVHPSSNGNDALFAELRERSEGFQNALTDLFFPKSEKTNELQELTLRYAVF